MTDELRRSIDRIRELSRKLNTATDEANRVVLAVEKFLNDECRLGLPAAVTVRSRPLQNPGMVTSEACMTLEYRRVDGKFRIAIGEKDDNLAGPPQERWLYNTWQDRPRGDKLESFPHLPELLQVLAKKVDSSIEKTQETCATVEQVMYALELQTMTSAALRDAMESATMPAGGTAGAAGHDAKTVRAFVKGPGDSFELNPEVARPQREAERNAPPMPTSAREEHYRQRTDRARREQ
jgi:hypothetical protein